MSRRSMGMPELRRANSVDRLASRQEHVEEPPAAGNSARVGRPTSRRAASRKGPGSYRSTSPCSNMPRCVPPDDAKAAGCTPTSENHSSVVTTAMAVANTPVGLRARSRARITLLISRTPRSNDRARPGPTEAREGLAKSVGRLGGEWMLARCRRRSRHGIRVLRVRGIRAHAARDEVVTSDERFFCRL